jgi:hypothetical protein
MILDKEIDGSDNQEALIYLWKEINFHQPISNSMGLNRITPRIKLETEQSEPLLLLADYVAGIAHAVKSNADTLNSSQITKDSVMKVYDRLINSGEMNVFDQDVQLRYFDFYPELRGISSPRSSD